MHNTAPIISSGTALRWVELVKMTQITLVTNVEDGRKLRHAHLALSIT